LQVSIDEADFPPEMLRQPERPVVTMPDHSGDPVAMVKQQLS
jgi:hypothetical protein